MQLMLIEHDRGRRSAYLEQYSIYPMLMPPTCATGSGESDNASNPRGCYGRAHLWQLVAAATRPMVARRGYSPRNYSGMLVSSGFPKHACLTRDSGWL